jgi:polysaccharide chain length determinant protein (PEP-CTERM system associated)
VNDLLNRLLEIARGMWRFRWPAMITAWIVCVLGWAVVLVMPDTFEASARVFVDTRTALSQVTQGIAVDTNVETQLQRVRQALLGGPQLEAVAKEAGLGAPGRTPQQHQAMMARLRDKIQISGTLAHDNAAAGLYVISYQDTDRDRSLRVVARLVNSFVQSTLGGKRESVEQAQQFLVDQIGGYERRLSETEQKLADFKKQNVGLMPGAQGDYFTRVQAEQDASDKVRGQLEIAMKRRDALERQLKGETPVLTTGAAANTGTNVNPGNDTATRIREAQARLDELLLRFTDKHPDVIALRQTLADLKSRQAAEIEALKRGDPGAAGRLGLNANPVYQQIELQLNQSGVDIAALQAEIADHVRRAAELRKMLNSAPEVEAQLAQLNRDYDVTRAQYNALVERLQRAKLSEQADETGIVSFEVIDPPSSPFSPVAPNRPVAMLLVLLAGIGAGAGLAYLLSQFKPVFTTVRQLSELTSLPVLGSVSMAWIDRHRLLQRRGILVYAGMGVVLLALSVVVLATQNQATSFAHALVR